MVLAERPPVSPGKMPNLVRFLARHQYTLGHLARACRCSTNGLHNAINRGQMSFERCLELHDLFTDAGHKVPRNLFVTVHGLDCFGRRPILSLRDGRVITATNQHDPRAAARRIATAHLSPQQLNPKKEKSMQPLTLTARRRFSLQYDPFRESLSSTDDVLESPEHKSAVEEITRAVKRQDFICIAGEVGCGKTTCMQLAKERLPHNVHLVRPLGADKAKITGANLYEAIILDLAGEVDAKAAVPASRERKARRVLSLLEALEKQDRFAALIIEDAQLLSKDCLRALKHLHELQRGFKRLLAIVLIAQREILPKLDDPTLREVGQRVAVFEFRGLNGKTEAYLRHKITRAGGNFDTIFDHDAIREIENRCTLKEGRRRFGPYPLQLNIVATQCLNEADELNSRKVTTGIVDSIKPLQ